jgi:Rhodopirellula transposase DDE domain
MSEQENPYRQLIRSAAQRLTGQQRRLFLAEVAGVLCGGNPRRCEREFGWGRQTVQLGLHEQDAGIRCLDNFHARGRHRTEDDRPQLAQDIRDLVEPQTQTDPKFQSPLRYTRITAAAVRQALIDHKGYHEDDLPGRRTFQHMLNRMGYRLKRIQKTKPLKKIKETNAIFANSAAVHEEFKDDPGTLEISIDTKAKVKLGDYSRHGRARSDSAGSVPQGSDHDPPAQKK